MSAENQDYPIPDLHHPARYCFQVVGRLDDSWVINFGDMKVATTRLAGGQVITEVVAKVPDQAGLHGLLNYFRDLGLPLVKVKYLPE